MFKFLLVACSTVLLAALVGGCGGSERLEYERDLAQVGRIVDDSIEQLPSDDAETIGPEQVHTIADDLREAADQLEDIDPPKDAARAQKRLERGLRGVAKAFDALAEQLGDATTDAAKAELFVQFATDEQVDAAFDDLIGAQEAFAAEGYRVFGTDVKAQAAKG
jgi:hypothetical protein